MRQLDVIDQLLQMQENLPLLSLTKMRKGKGIKDEVKEVLKLSKGLKDESKCEYELIGVLRHKPYVKSGESKFEYDVKE